MRLIDADELAEELSKRVWYEREDEKQAVRIVKEFPTVDAVPVVRCRECKWFDGQELCNRHGFFVGLDLTFFCKSGKRREEEQDAAD